jgi:hypothetical protein
MSQCLKYVLKSKNQQQQKKNNKKTQKNTKQPKKEYNYRSLRLKQLGLVQTRSGASCCFLKQKKVTLIA